MKSLRLIKIEYSIHSPLPYSLAGTIYCEFSAAPDPGWPVLILEYLCLNLTWRLTQILTNLSVKLDPLMEATRVC